MLRLMIYLSTTNMLPGYHLPAAAGRPAAPGFAPPRPPGRLVLAPVPVEQAGRQRPRLPLARFRGDVPRNGARRLRGDAGRQRCPDPGGLGVLGHTRLLR